MSEHEIFTIDIDVRFRDIDAMGHVNNAVFFTYFEQGRVGFFHAASQEKKFPGFAFILAQIGCNYIKPVTIDDRLTLQIWVGKIGRKSFTFKYQLIDRSDPAIIYATAESVQVSYDYQKNASMPVSEKIREQLSVYLEE